MGQSKGQQPEAEASLEAAARSGSRKPKDQGLTAKPDTSPEPTDLEKDQQKAARIFRSGAEKDTAKDR